MGETLILGSSHVLQFSSAVGEHNVTWTDATDLVPIKARSGIPTTLVFTSDRPSFMTLRQGADGRVAADFGPQMKLIRRFNRKDAKVVLGVGGNEHNIRFLRADPQPFDFFHPASPGVLPGRQILPLSVMRQTLSERLQRNFVVTRLIAAELPRAQRFYLPPPPPIPSEAQIRKSPEVFDFNARPVEAASVRLKIYALYLEAVRAFCGRAGLTFLPPTPDHCDAEGFLKEPYWRGATHATADYYRDIVAELGL